MADNILGIFGIFAFSSFALMCGGCLSPYLVTVNNEELATLNVTRSSCTFGLLGSNNCNAKENVFSATVVALTSGCAVYLLIIPFFWCCQTVLANFIRRRDSGEMCQQGDTIFAIYAFIYLIGGVWGAVSCITLAINYDARQFGWSFYLIVGGTINAILLGILLFLYYIKKRGKTKKKKNDSVYTTGKNFDLSSLNKI